MDKLLSTSLKSCDSNRMKYNYCVHIDGRVDYLYSNLCLSSTLLFFFFFTAVSADYAGKHDLR